MRKRTHQLPGSLPLNPIFPSRASALKNARPFHPIAIGRPSPLRLHVRMPTRSRPEQALSVLAKYREMAGCPITLEAVVNTDDDSMWSPAVQEKLAALDCLVTHGAFKNKVDAVNGGNKALPWDVLLLASDDMVPVSPGYGARILHVMQEHFPLLDGALYFDDGYAGERLCTLPIVGRRLYDQFGYLYFPCYQSFFCDNEQTDVWKAMGRLDFIPEMLIEHRHPVKGVPSDALYEQNAGPWSADEALYQARKARGFDAPAPILSVLIATLPERRDQLDRLTAFLWTQALCFPRQVEVLIDPGPGSTGAKRNQLLARARGEFVAFVDDDDHVAADYVPRIVAAIRAVPDCDCVEFHVRVGASGAVGHCSIRYQDWTEKPGFYARTPNHLSPVRRALALKAGFPDKTLGEDYDYACRLRPLLRKEAPTANDPLYFYIPSVRT